MDFKKAIKEYYDREKKVIDSLNYEEINDAMNQIYETYQKGGNIYICGNGGSASTASHFQNDFNYIPCNYLRYSVRCCSDVGIFFGYRLRFCNCFRYFRYFYRDRIRSDVGILLSIALFFDPTFDKSRFLFRRRNSRCYKFVRQHYASAVTFFVPHGNVFAAL